MLTMKMSCHSHNRVSPAPQMGPSTPPASAAPPMTPRMSALLLAGNMSADAAIAIGTSAPPPAACTTRDATNRVKFGATQHRPLPSAKRPSAMTHIRRLPRTSARRPNRGIATV